MCNFRCGYIFNKIAIYGKINKESDSRYKLESYETVRMSVMRKSVPLVLKFQDDAPKDLQKSICLLGVICRCNKHIVVKKWKYTEDKQECIEFDSQSR